MTMGSLSVTIITKNAEKHIKNCLEAIAWADEIVVVDHMSNDRTVEICRGYPKVKVFLRKEEKIFGPTRNYTLEKATGEWILALDADEIVTPQLAEEIKEAMRSSDKLGYFLCRKNIFLGRWIKSCGWWPDYNIRLFRKGAASWPKQIHNTIYISDSGRLGYLNNPLIHNSYLSLEGYFYKFNFYTDQLALEAYETGSRNNKFNFCLHFIIKPLFFFLKKFFFLNGYKDGFYGFFISFSSALVIFVTYAKLWEISKVAVKKNDDIG